MQVRQNLGELLNWIKYRQDTILITKGGEPVAAMVDINLFNNIRMLEKEFSRLVEELRKAYPEDEQDKALQDADQALRWARRKIRASKK